MIKLNKHPYIKLIEFALEQGNNSFTVTQACEMSSPGHSHFDAIKEGIFALAPNQTGPTHSASLCQSWRVSAPAYFGYLQFLAYGHAVEVAERAHRLALCALAVTALIGVGSIVAALTPLMGH